MEYKIRLVFVKGDDIEIVNQFINKLDIGNILTTREPVVTVIPYVKANAVYDLFVNTLRAVFVESNIIDGTYSYIIKHNNDIISINEFGNKEFIMNSTLDYEKTIETIEKITGYIRDDNILHLNIRRYKNEEES